MTSRLAVLVIDANDVGLVARFWCDVLGWLITGEDSDGVISIGPADGPGPTIDVAPVPEHKAVKNRLHLDLRAEGISTAAELARLRGLGARPVDVGQDPASTWTVLADPEGNEFCLLARAAQDL